MITPEYVRTLARYNLWQNTNIYGAASTLADDQRREDRGAFFRSIHATLNHILWADQMWLTRFGAATAPAAKSIAEGLEQFGDWSELVTAREKFDRLIEAWADQLGDEGLAGDLTWYSGATGREMTRPRSITVVHVFNHQTHHRGQVHAMLTGFGVKPGPTDLPFASFVVG